MKTNFNNPLYSITAQPNQQVEYSAHQNTRRDRKYDSRGG